MHPLNSLQPFGNFFTILLFILFSGQSVMAINIQMGGAPDLNPADHKILHQETFDSAKPKETIFWGVLGVGDDTRPPWSGELSKDCYTLTNNKKVDAVRYYFRERIDQNSKTLSEYGISVEIEGTTGEKIAGAGLIYGYNADTKNYLAFIKGAGNSYAIYQKDKDGLRRVMGGNSEAIRPHQANKISIIPSGNIINFYINSKHFAAIKQETAPIGAAGILAISSGMFLFDNFTVLSPAAPTSETEIKAVAEKTQELQKTVPATVKKERPQPTPVPGIKREPDIALIKPGMKKKDILEALGKPAYMRGPHFFYNLEKDGEEKTTTLVVQFDDQDKVLNHKTVVQ